jgi:predicted RNase H-like HicB family nuclease
MADVIREGSQSDDQRACSENSGKGYRCKVRLCPDESGGYFVVALNLPGVVSEGDTEEEAIANMREACAGAIESYLAHQGSIPWRSVDAEECDGSKELWIAVDA